jgi:hypothetical protein
MKAALIVCVSGVFGWGNDNRRRNARRKGPGLGRQLASTFVHGGTAYAGAKAVDAGFNAIGKGIQGAVGPKSATAQTNEQAVNPQVSGKPVNPQIGGKAVNPQGNEQAAQAACQIEQQSFLKCLETNFNAIGQCQVHFDMLRKCDSSPEATKRQTNDASLPESGVDNATKRQTNDLSLPESSVATKRQTNDLSVPESSVATKRQTNDASLPESGVATKRQTNDIASLPESGAILATKRQTNDIASLPESGAILATKRQTNDAA